MIMREYQIKGDTSQKSCNEHVIPHKQWTNSYLREHSTLASRTCSFRRLLFTKGTFEPIAIEHDLIRRKLKS